MPSRPITYTRGEMAAPMDILDAEGGRGKSASSLSVSRSSTKINKNLRRAVTQQRPAPQVYKTEPAEFRSLVQHLTGTSPPAESSSTILTPKPLNPRLQRIAPPPLRPIFSYPAHTLTQQQQQQQNHQSEFNPGPRMFNSLPASMAYQNQQLAGGSQRPSNFAVSPLSFSPLPALTPSDQIWANVMTNPVESPGSAALRRLAQGMSSARAGEEARIASEGLSLPDRSLSPEFSRFAGSLHQSPRVSPPFNLPSPGMPSGFGLGNMFGFSAQFSPAAAMAMDNSFSFSDRDIPRSSFP